MNQLNKARLYFTELLLLIVVIIWAANYPLAKYAMREFSPFVFNSIRFLVAAVTVSGIFFFRSSWKRIEQEDRRKVIVNGLVASIIYQLAFIVGLSMTTAGNSAVLLSTSPLWTIFFNARLHKEKIQPRTIIGMIISLCGVIMIIIGSGKKLEFGSNALFGDLISLAAAALWALNTNLQKPLLAKYSTVQVSVMLVTIGAFGLTLFAIPTALETPWSSVHWTYYLAAIASGVLSIGIANMFWSYGVKRLGPTGAANFNNLVPVIAFTIAYFTLHEQVLAIQMVGAAITIAGVWIARK